jgi:hypothetical protein
MEKFGQHVLAALALVSASVPLQAQSDPGDDLTDATCGDYIAALKRADPGKSANDAQTRAAQTAQDALVDIAVWVHGYQSGRAGPNAQLLPFDNAFIEAMVVRLARQCTAKSPDGKMPIIDIIRTF